MKSEKDKLSIGDPNKKEERARSLVTKGMAVYMGGSHAQRKGKDLKGKSMKYVGKKMIDAGGARLKNLQDDDVVDKLKCGGKVKKADGGKVLDVDAMSLLASGASDLLSNTTEEVIAAKKKALLLNPDNRIDPRSAMQKSSNLDTANSLIKGAASGAAAGTAVLPGIGTAIGAAAGLLTSGIGRWLGAKDRQKEMAEASEAWREGWDSRTASGLRKSGYKKGGEIKGSGTGKSDSIDMSAEEGSFIVPAENADYANELGMTYLGWNADKTAQKKNGGTNIKASNGEVLFTPEEVSVLKYHGIDVDSLAPNAKTMAETNKFAIGLTPEKDEYKYQQQREAEEEAKRQEAKGLSTGITTTKEEVKKTEPGNDWKYDPTSKLAVSKSRAVAYDKKGNEYKVNPTTNQFEATGKKDPYGASIYSEVDESGSILDLAPEMMGAIQAAGGAYGLIEAGRAPDMQVSSTLKKLSSEVRRLAEFGYEPAVLNALNTEIENTRRDLSSNINQAGGASGLERMGQLNTLLSTTIDKKAGLAFANAAEKARKYADVLKVDTLKAGQEFDINKIRVDDWYRNQEVFADLVTAGVSNIVGARQLKTEQDTVRKIGSNNPTFGK